MKTLILFFSLLICSPGIANAEGKVKWIIEENSLRFPVENKASGGISEQQFNKVIDDVEALYAPIVSRMGGKLSVARLWTDATANANATRMGSNWKINMYGGLARHPSITMDGFYLVLCHELGHHIGGSPKIVNFLSRWASNEGQSDYFSTLKCLRNVFLNDNNAKVVKSLKIPAFLSDACVKAHPNKEDQMICQRSGMAGVSVAGFFASVRNQKEPQFDTPDMKIVTKTNDSHPDTQCRLDTYFQGALCEKLFSEDVSQADEVQGTCHSSTGQKIGLRPLCWFKPSK